MKKIAESIKISVVIIVGIMVMVSFGACGGKASSGKAAESSSAEPIRLKAGMGAVLTTVYGQGLVRIAEEIKQATGGKIEVECY